LTVVPDDDLVEESFEQPCDEPSGTRTPPTPEVSPSHAPPLPAPPLRQRAMAQLLPVSVPAVIKDMAGKNRVLDTWNYIPGGSQETADNNNQRVSSRLLLFLLLLLLTLSIIIVIIAIIAINFQLDYEPADVKHSSFIKFIRFPVLWP
jgi:hypothetical protein